MLFHTSVLLSLFVVSTLGASQLGLCAANLPVGSCLSGAEAFPAAISRDAAFAGLTFPVGKNEIWVGFNFEFDALKVNQVTAIELDLASKVEACTGECGDLTQLAKHPATCTKGLVETRLYTFATKPDEPVDNIFSTEEPVVGTLAAVLNLGDKSISFNYGQSYARFGGVTNKKWGRLVFRFIKTTPIVLPFDFGVKYTFHIACEAGDAGVYAGYLTGIGLSTPLLSSFPAPQIRSGKIAIPDIQNFLAIQQTSEITLEAINLYSREYIIGGSVEVVSDGVRTVVHEWKGDFFTTGPTVAKAIVKKGDFIQWTCQYDTTRVPALPFVPEGPVIASPSYYDYSCVFAAVYTNSRCGGALYIGSFALAPDCPEPVFSPEAETPKVSVPALVYDYDPNHGICSDGSQWLEHPYRCTDQFGGGTCAFCTGRANNEEVKTCINRNGLTCNEIFDSWERKSWCNMEFECPASTFTLSFFVAFFAFFLAMLM